jgi:P-type Cu2+ transporter
MSTLAAIVAAPAITPVADATSCFHCGLPLGSRTYAAVVNGVSRDTCCRGCQAVAQLIAAQGLTAYYRNRAALPSEPAPAPDASAAAAGQYAAHDFAQVQAGYVLHIDDTRREAALLLEGVTCAACLWLIEQRLARLGGVLSASANHATRRLRITWDETRVKLSAILAAVAALGYQAHLYDQGRAEAALARERRTLLWRLFVAAFGMMQVMMYAFPAYVAQGDMPADIERLMRFAGLALTLPVMTWSAAPFFRGAWRGLRARSLNMDVPVAIGIAAAFAASVAATLTGKGAVYYDSIAMFVFLLLGARYLELQARAVAAREQDRLARLVPALATRLTRTARRDLREQVPAAALQPGDLIEIKPGAAAPGDGVVVEGTSRVNEALLTGESRLQSKAPGSRVIAGSVNGEDALVVRLTHTGAQSTVAGIVRLMDRALEARPRLAVLADRVASYFVLALLVTAAVSAAAWWFIDRERVLWVTISLLVVTCPCALSLATPAALAAATGSLARRGILVTRGHALEALAGATHFVFDKTGTLTTGCMRLIGVLPLADENRDTVTAMAAALEAASEHPVGRALASAAPAQLIYRASDLHYLAGQGVEGVIDGVRMRVGAPGFVAALAGSPPPPEMVFVSDDVTTVALGRQGAWLALFTLGEAVRPGARHIVRALVDAGREVHLLSGDRAACVARMAERLGIAVARGDATPADKLAYVRDLQARGAAVAVIGDGVNDAPVLAQAQVSLAMASGTELARINADIALLTDGIEPVLDAVVTARRTLAIIRQNFLWAVIYNAIAVPLALMGLVTPLVAAAGMSASSLLVIGNALRLCDARAPRTRKD